LKIRWLIFTLGAILVFVAILLGDIANAAINFGIGVILGLLIDLVGIKLARRVLNINLWQYTRTRFPTRQYFTVVLPCWGVLVMSINLICDWFTEYTTVVPWIVLIAVIVVLFSFHELINLKTKSWEYNAPMWLVAIGWPLLVLFIRAVYLLPQYLIS
jgi:hypothetical protein